MGDSFHPCTRFPCKCFFYCKGRTKDTFLSFACSFLKTYSANSLSKKQQTFDKRANNKQWNNFCLSVHTLRFLSSRSFEEEKRSIKFQFFWLLSILFIICSLFIFIKLFPVRFIFTQIKGIIFAQPYLRKQRILLTVLIFLMSFNKLSNNFRGEERTFFQCSVLATEI